MTLIAIGGVEFSETRGGLTEPEARLRINCADKALTNARERADKTAETRWAMKIESRFRHIDRALFLRFKAKIFPKCGTGYCYRLEHSNRTRIRRSMSIASRLSQ